MIVHRTATVKVPELGLEVTVRGPSRAELRGTGEDVSHPEQRRRVLLQAVAACVVSPKLTVEQAAGLSEDSLNRISAASLRLHPKTAALLRRAEKLSPTQLEELMHR